MRDAHALLDDPGVRLLTLTGPGGIGKTRLAIAVAGERREEVAFVPLATVIDPAGIAAAILQALGATPGSRQPDAETLRDILRTRRLLLVLDNLEHLLAGTPLIVELLNACPNLTVLATSRVRLGLTGERVLPVDPLETPAPRAAHGLDAIAAASGVRLYVERAQAVVPAFRLTAQNAEAVAAICQRLDGLPLAIELAAARSNVLSPAMLAERLEHRLALLTGGPWDAPARHQTMRAAIAWSYGLLTPAEQRLFLRLAVFEGGASLEAVEAIAVRPDHDVPPDAAHAIDLLSTLVDHHLVDSTETPADSGETRIEMAGTLRELAQELLAASGEEAAIRDAHAEIYLALAREGETHLVREVEPAWLDRLELDHANFGAALAWTLRDGGGPGSAATGAEMAGALWLFWYYHSHLTEGRTWLERALATPMLPTPARAHALLGLGTLLHFHGEPERAREVLVEGLGLLRELGDLSGVAYALTGLGNIAEDVGRYEGATEAFTEAHALFSRLDDQVNIAVTRYHLGIVAVGQGDLPRATEQLEGALALSRRLGDPWNTAGALSYLGLVRGSTGNTAGAVDALDEALALYRQLGTTERILEVLRRVAVLLAERRHAAPALRLYAAADAHGYRIGSLPALPERDLYEAALARAARRLPALDREREAAIGSGLTLEAAMADAARWLDTLRQTPPQEQRADPGPSGLSQREMEVLRLIVDGATNEEIAARLGIAQRTAAQHVAAILGKLGVSNRTAATTIALRRGLV
jgi:non-specific serine/threonine protein kinase